MCVCCTCGVSPVLSCPVFQGVAKQLPEQHGGVPCVQPGDGVISLHCLNDETHLALSSYIVCTLYNIDDVFYHRPLPR